MLVNALSVALIVDCSSDDRQSVIWSSLHCIAFLAFLALHCSSLLHCIVHACLIVALQCSSLSHSLHCRHA